MNRILLLLLLLVSFANAQTWQPTSIRQRFVNGIGIPTRDTITGTAADSSQLVLRPQDSVIYYKYKGYWRALASGGSVALYTSTVKHEVKAAVPITKGQAVYVSSADGTNMIVSKSDNTSEQTSSKTMGLLESTVAANGKTFVITEGLLAGLNTSMASAGDAVWLGTNGDLLYGIANKPKAPAHMVFIGIVTRSNVSNGEIFVKVQNGFELDELHDVAISSPRNQSIILYDSVNKLWRDTLASVVTANKVNYTDTAAMLSPYLRSATATATYEPKITAGTTSQYWRGDKSWQTLPTYTLAGLGGQPQLNGTGFVKASGTTISYDNNTYYLASNPNGYTSNTGTVTSIATTAPLTGGTITTSGTLGITQATTSTSGYLSSTDWNTFNGKQNALTNPTTGTGTTNYVTKWTGSSTLGNSSIYDNGTNVGIGTASPTQRLTVATTDFPAASFYRDLDVLSVGQAGQRILIGARKGSTFTSGASISGVLEGTGDEGTINFETLNSGTLQTRMHITSAGNVGIGTTTPTASLQVLGLTTLAANTRYLKTHIGGAQSWGANSFEELGLGYSGIRSIYSGSGESWDLAFSTGTSTTFNLGTQPERMRITSAGYVGIGTSSPANKLDVNGTLGVTGAATFSSSVAEPLIINTSSSTMYTTYISNSVLLGYIGNGNGIVSGGGATNFGIRAENNLLFTAGGNNERMRITSAGNVLINSTTDDGSNKLQVTGSIKSTSLAGTGERLVTADANGKLLAGTGTFTAISGTYTPTYTAIANTAATGAYTLSYTVVGNVVTIFGRVNINSSTPNSVTTVDMTTPTAVQYITSGSVGGAGTEIATDGSRTQATLGFIESPVNTPINLIRILCKPMLSGNLVQYRFTVSYLINTSL